MPVDLKMRRKCVAAYNAGMNTTQIYKEIFSPEYPEMSLAGLRRNLFNWRKREHLSDETLDRGTYEGFVPHGATVQVDAGGNLVQAWIKQSREFFPYEDLVEVIKQNVKPIDILPPDKTPEARMLEISLYDMHFPISDHVESLWRLCEIIRVRFWEDIYIIIGQDMLHNDDMRGHTSSGRDIEKVDIPRAWNMARSFWSVVVETALQNSSHVHVIYSKGNHDESLSWCFVQWMKAAYPAIEVDDSLKNRKLIFWRGNFIGITHGSNKKSAPADLRNQFTIQYPIEFASASIREIHAGHLHQEKESDISGVMVRRLSRNGIDDDWSEDEGLVGAAKRFMVFDWSPNWLSAIYYI